MLKENHDKEEMDANTILETRIKIKIMNTINNEEDDDIEYIFSDNTHNNVR